MLSVVMLSININLTQASEGQVLYGDYVLISNTSLQKSIIRVIQTLTARRIYAMQYRHRNSVLHTAALQVIQQI